MAHFFKKKALTKLNSADQSTIVSKENAWMILAHFPTKIFICFCYQVIIATRGISARNKI